MAGRKPNQISTEGRQVTLTAGVWEYLTDLLQTHRFGSDVSAVAQRLIERGIEQEIEKGTLKKRGSFPRLDRGK